MAFKCQFDSLHTVHAGMDGLRVVEVACEKVYHHDLTFSVLVGGKAGSV